MRLRAFQPDNPILRAEINHQQRTIPRWLQWFDRFGVVVVALVVSFVLLYLPAVNDLYGTASMPSQQLLSMLLAVSWITQLVVILRGLLGGLNTMHQQQWDVLALTGISPRQLFIGKWWSALHQLRGWLLALGIIKLAAAAVVILNLIVFCYRNPLQSLSTQIDYYSHGPRPLIESAFLLLPTDFPALPSVERIVVTGALTVATTVLEVMASTALGVAGGLVPHKVIGLVSVLVLRFSPVVGFTLFPNAPFTSGRLEWRWLEYTWFSLADGGSTAIMRSGLTSRAIASGKGVTESVLLAFYAAIAMYLVYLLFAFVVSHILLRRQGLLPAGAK